MQFVSFCIATIFEKTRTVLVATRYKILKVHNYFHEFLVLLNRNTQPQSNRLFIKGNEYNKNKCNKKYCFKIPKVLF